MTEIHEINHGEDCNKIGMIVEFQVGTKVIYPKYSKHSPYTHSGRMDSNSIPFTIDAPPGVPGVSKNQNFYFTNKTVELLS